MVVTAKLSALAGLRKINYPYIWPRHCPTTNKPFYSVDGVQHIITSLEHLSGHSIMQTDGGHHDFKIYRPIDHVSFNCKIREINRIAAACLSTA